jgi:hypothetical protein
MWAEAVLAVAQASSLSNVTLSVVRMAHIRLSVKRTTESHSLNNEVSKTSLQKHDQILSNYFRTRPWKMLVVVNLKILT